MLYLTTSMEGSPKLDKAKQGDEAFKAQLLVYPTFVVAKRLSLE